MSNNVDSVVKKLKKTRYLGILQEYLLKLHSCDIESLSATIEIFDTVFDYYGNSDLIKDFDNCEFDDDVHDDADDARIKIKEFLSKSFRSYFEMILSRLEENVQDLDQVAILDTLMRTLKLNYKILFKRRNSKPGKENFALNFPNNYFKKILQAYLSCKSKEELKERFEELLVFDDIRYYTLKNIGVILDSNPEGHGHPNLETIFETLMNCTHFNVPDKVTSFFKDVFTDANFGFSSILNNYKAVFSSAWLRFLKQPNLTTKTQKRILVSIDTKILPHLSDPKLLIDFLTDSYEVGGVHSLLALNGLFVLMNQYNLDYTDFYTKLYGLLSPSVFHVKYKTRFFHLLDLFLSSTHLPNYLVAGFIKRISRIMIFAHVDDAEMLLVFIRTLFIQHPSSQTLIHRNSANVDNVNADPYIFDELDPWKCQASRSCLWELDTMKSHYSSEVLKQVTLFKKEFPKMENNLREYCDRDFKNIVTSKMNSEGNEEIPLSSTREKDVFKGFDRNNWEFE